MSDANIESSAPPAEAAAPNEAPADAADLSPEEAAAEAEEAAKLEAKSKIKKYQIKANNKTRDIEIDWSDDKQIEQYLAKAVGADEKFQEAATLRKQVEQLVNELKSNPLAILKHPQLGIDIKALAQQVLNEELEEMQLTPEQKQIKELESKLKDKEEKEKALETEREAAQRAKFEQEAMESLDSSITDALGKSNLPKSPYVIRRMADSMIAAMEMGYADVTPEQVLPFVEEQILGEINRLFESSPDDMFDKVMENVVGKKHLDKYRKSKVSKSKKPSTTVTAAQVKDTGASVKPKEKASEEPGRRFKDIFKTF
jgi:hypothetical protein